MPTKLVDKKESSALKDLARSKLPSGSGFITGGTSLSTITR